MQSLERAQVLLLVLSTFRFFACDGKSAWPRISTSAAAPSRPPRVRLPDRPARVRGARGLVHAVFGERDASAVRRAGRAPASALARPPCAPVRLLTPRLRLVSRS